MDTSGDIKDSCNECTHSLTYLYKKGVISEELFTKIIAGHQNKKFYELVSTLRPTRSLYDSIKFIPKNIVQSFTTF